MTGFSFEACICLSLIGLELNPLVWSLTLRLAWASLYLPERGFSSLVVALLLLSFPPIQAQETRFWPAYAV